MSLPLTVIACSVYQAESAVIVTIIVSHILYIQVGILIEDITGAVISTFKAFTLN
jgi:hypothetical protein